jgi:hypothetical protein
VVIPALVIVTTTTGATVVIRALRFGIAVVAVIVSAVAGVGVVGVVTAVLDLRSTRRAGVGVVAVRIGSTIFTLVVAVLAFTVIGRTGVRARTSVVRDTARVAVFELALESGTAVAIRVARTANGRGADRNRLAVRRTDVRRTRIARRAVAVARAGVVALRARVRGLADSVPGFACTAITGAAVTVALAGERRRRRTDRGRAIYAAAGEQRPFDPSAADQEQDSVLFLHGITSGLVRGFTVAHPSPSRADAHLPA